MYFCKFPQDKKKYEKSDTFWVSESGVTRRSKTSSAIEITSGKTASLPSFSWELFKSFKKIHLLNANGCLLALHSCSLADRLYKVALH